MFVHDVPAGVTQRVSTDVALQETALGSDGVVDSVALSGDGRFVAFSTLAALVEPDENGVLQNDLYLRGAMVPVISSVVAIDPATQAEVPPILHTGANQLVVRGKVFGPSVTAALGAGVTASVTASTPTGLLVSVDVAPSAARGPRDVVVGNLGTVGVLAVSAWQRCQGCVTIAGS